MPTNGVFYSQTKGLSISTNSLTRVFVQTGGTTTFTGITSGNTIVEVQGVSGQVMRVTDCANGVLFSSNNVSGTPIFQTNSCGSIIGGIGSTSTANATTIGGGCNNSTTANYSTVGGGCNNTSSYIGSTVGGGICNTSSGIYSTVGGGRQNTSSCDYSTIGGGVSNTSCGCFSTIGGGYQNTSCGCFSTIGGGRQNTSSCDYSTIGGGVSNTSCGCYSTIGGGLCNTASCDYSTIGGGKNNSGNAVFVTVGGGEFNCVSGIYSTIGGGRYNTNTGTHSTIGGGRSNTNCGDDVTIGGGRANYVSSAYNHCSTIGGGLTNCVLDNSCFSFIGGGRNNTITTSSCCSGILGGGYNTISNHYNSFVIGSNITTTLSNYTFVNNLCSFGQVIKAGGSFKISHPNPDKNKTHYLIHSFVESPTAGDNIYRYEVESIDGVAEINLPDYFSYLNENIQVWVSGKNNFGNGYGEVSVDLKKIEIHTSIDGIYNVLVIGTRKDDHAKKYWKGTEEEKNIK